MATDSVFPLDIPADLEVENLKAFCEAEAGIPVKEMILLFEGKPLREDEKTVEQCGIKVRHPFPGLPKRIWRVFVRGYTMVGVSVPQAIIGAETSSITER